MDEENEQSMGDLITYEIDYGDDQNRERFQITAGSNAERLIKDYVKAYGYEIREIEGGVIEPPHQLLTALRNLVMDWERVIGPIPEDHEAKAVITKGEGDAS